MQIVIDIPEEEYEECKMQVEMIKQEGFLIESLNTALKIHVANGTPLPKGRLYKRLIRPIINYPNHNYDNISEPLEEKWYDEEYAEYLREKHKSDPRYDTFVHYSIEEKFIEIDLGAEADNI